MVYFSHIGNTTEAEKLQRDDIEFKNILSRGSHIQALKYLPCILLIVLCMVAGIIGNIGVCVVYAPKVRKSNANVFILQLAIYDLVICILVLPFTIATLSTTFTFESSVLCKINFYIQYIFTGASMIILLAIAVDRYFKVCRPLKPGLSLSVAKMIRWISLAGGALTTALVPYLYDITKMVYIDEKGRSFSGQTCGISSSVLGGIPHNVHVCALFTIFMIIFVIMIILYGLVGRELWRRRKIVHAEQPFATTRLPENGPIVAEDSPTVDLNLGYTASREDRQTIVPSSGVATINTRNSVHDIWSRARKRVQTAIKRKEMRKANRGTTTMLFLVSLLFLLTWLPFWIIVIDETMVAEMAVTEDNSTNLLWAPDNLLVRTGRSLFLINHAVNPIIYSLVSKTFRTECAFRLKKIWRGRICR